MEESAIRMSKIYRILFLDSPPAILGKYLQCLLISRIIWIALFDRGLGMRDIERLFAVLIIREGTIEVMDMFKFIPTGNASLRAMISVCSASSPSAGLMQWTCKIRVATNRHAARKNTQSVPLYGFE
jgi:hypothetical protein